MSMLEGDFHFGNGKGSIGTHGKYVIAGKRSLRAVHYKEGHWDDLALKGAYGH